MKFFYMMIKSILELIFMILVLMIRLIRNMKNLKTILGFINKELSNLRIGK